MTPSTTVARGRGWSKDEITGSRLVLELVFRAFLQLLPWEGLAPFRQAAASLNHGNVSSRRKSYCKLHGGGGTFLRGVMRCVLNLLCEEEADEEDEEENEVIFGK